MIKKRALITGISGQDGAYLAKLLLKKGYSVVGGERQNRADRFPGALSLEATATDRPPARRSVHVRACRRLSTRV